MGARACRWSCAHGSVCGLVAPVWGPCAPTPRGRCDRLPHSRPPAKGPCATLRVCQPGARSRARGAYGHPERGDPSRIFFPLPGPPLARGGSGRERPRPNGSARCCGCQAHRPRAGARMGFSMTASGPGRLCSRCPRPARAPGFFQGSTGAWRSRLRAPAPRAERIHSFVPPTLTLSP